MEVLVILGNRMSDDGSLSDLCVRRLELGLAYYERFRPDCVIVSGGLANKKAGVTEAEAMSKYLLAHGIDDGVIVKEDRSLTTAENAKFSLPMAALLGADVLIVCTTAEHASRRFLNPLFLFKKYGKAYPKIKIGIFSQE